MGSYDQQRRKSRSSSAQGQRRPGRPQSALTYQVKVSQVPTSTLTKIEEEGSRCGLNTTVEKPTHSGSRITNLESLDISNSDLEEEDGPDSKSSSPPKVVLGPSPEARSDQEIRVERGKGEEVEPEVLVTPAT